jgi:type IV pilus assembly protein PilA
LLTGTAPVDLPQRQMRLQFRDRVSLSPSFAHWIEMLIDPAPELRFSNAHEALLALQANSSPSSLLETADTEPQKNAPKGRNGGIKIAVFQYVFFFLFSIVVPSLFIQTVKGKQAEGKQNIGSMIRAQEAYFLEYQQFTEDFQQLGIGIKNPSTKYEYSIRATPLAVFNYATARTKAIKNSVGAVFLKVDNEQTGALSTVKIFCETEIPFDWLPNWAKVQQAPPPAEPPIVQGNAIKCGLNTKSVSYRNEAERIVLDKDSALAYSAVNDATAGQYDKALEVAQTINNADFQARALATIAIKLAEQRQYDKALEVTKTIQEGSSKQMALDAITIQLAEKGQYDKALEVANSIQDDAIKQRALEAIAPYQK